MEVEYFIHLPISLPLDLLLSLARVHDQLLYSLERLPKYQLCDSQPHRLEKWKTYCYTKNISWNQFTLVKTLISQKELSASFSWSHRKPWFEFFSGATENPLYSVAPRKNFKKTKRTTLFCEKIMTIEL